MTRLGCCQTRYSRSCVAWQTACSMSRHKRRRATWPTAAKWYLPPALGQVRGVASKTAEGRDVSLEEQHGIGGVIHGLETRKAGDINRLLAGTGQASPASDYIGPTLKT